MPKPATPRFEYKHFTNPEHREAMKQGISNIIRFARKKNVAAIVIAGSSGIVTRHLFLHTWKTLHPGEQTPKIFSLGNIEDLAYEKSNDAMAAETEKRLRTLPDALVGKGKLLILDEWSTSGSILHEQKKNICAVLKKLGAKPTIYTAAMLGFKQLPFFIFSRPTLIGAIHTNPEDKMRRKMGYRAKSPFEAHYLQRGYFAKGIFELIQKRKEATRPEAKREITEKIRSEFARFELPKIRQELAQLASEIANQ